MTPQSAPLFFCFAFITHVFKSGFDGVVTMTFKSLCTAVRKLMSLNRMNDSDMMMSKCEKMQLRTIPNVQWLVKSQWAHFFRMSNAPLDFNRLSHKAFKTHFFSLESTQKLDTTFYGRKLVVNLFSLKNSHFCARQITQSVFNVPDRIELNIRSLKLSFRFTEKERKKSVKKYGIVSAEVTVPSIRLYVTSNSLELNIYANLA